MRNRIAIVGLLLGACLFGCDGATTKSPWSQKEVSAGELLAEVTQREADAKAKALAEERADKAEARRVAIKATSDSIAASAKLDITAAEVKAELARITAESGAATQAIAERAADRQAGLDQALKSIAAQADAAFGDIQAKEAQRMAAVNWIANNPVVKGAAGSVGIDTGGLPAIFGASAAAYALSSWQGRKAKDEVVAEEKRRRDALRAELQAKADAAWDEGHKTATTARDAQDAAHDEATARAMALLVDPSKLIASLTPKP